MDGAVGLPEEATGAEAEEEAPLFSWTSEGVMGIVTGLMEAMLGMYSRISPGSSGSGPQGSCSLQDNLPSSFEIKSMPSRCSLQNELGHISQKEAASLPHMSHWCQGHSHRPGDEIRVRFSLITSLVLTTS